MNNQRNVSNDKISKTLLDSASLTRILQSGIYDALLQHKRAGNAVCEWRNNRVVWIPAERIPVKSRKQSRKK